MIKLVQESKENRNHLSPMIDIFCPVSLTLLPFLSCDCILPSFSRKNLSFKSVKRQATHHLLFLYLFSSDGELTNVRNVRYSNTLR